jgi:flagellin-like protein
MKGITPVIAIVLLLMITISMVGFAFIWFSRMMETTTNQTSSALQNQLSQQSKKIKIDNIDPAGSIAYVRNIGSASIQTSEVSLYVNNGVQTCAWTGTLDVNAVAACDWSSGACTSGSVIKVVAPGNQDISTC